MIDSCEITADSS